MARGPKRPPSEPHVPREPDVPPEPDGHPKISIPAGERVQMTPPGIEPTDFPRMTQAPSELWPDCRFGGQGTRPQGKGAVFAGALEKVAGSIARV